MVPVILSACSMQSPVMIGFPCNAGTGLGSLIQIYLLGINANKQRSSLRFDNDYQMKDSAPRLGQHYFHKH